LAAPGGAMAQIDLRDVVERCQVLRITSSTRGETQNTAGQDMAPLPPRARELP
jgi:hypothetical protein